MPQAHILPTPAPDAPMVSILLITYNHGPYIGQAMESILAQETCYSFKIHVIEDCSTDNTQEVVMRYVQQYPDKVVPFFNEVNIGHEVTQKNFIRGLRTMNGKYWAVLEGDDYWNSPHKLQKQIDFLEANPDFVACAHNTMKVYEDGSKEPHRFMYWDGMKQEHTLEDFILLQSFFHASSLMFRNVYMGNPPEHYANPWQCDIFMNLDHARFGKVRYFDEDMSVYRAHAGGRFSGMKTLDGWMWNIGGLIRYNCWLNFRYLRLFSRSIARFCLVVLNSSGKDNVPALSLLQTFKYLSLAAFYGLAFLLLDIPYRGWKIAANISSKVLRNDSPFYVVLTLILLPVALPLAFLLGLFKSSARTCIQLANSFIPDRIKQQLIAFEARFPKWQRLRRVAMYGSASIDAAKKNGH